MRRRTLLHISALAPLSLATGRSQAAWVKQDPLELLRRELRGRLLLPGDRQYGQYSEANGNARFQGILPRAVALIADDRDGQLCLRWCRDHGVPFSLRGGGHNYAGFSSSSGLVISTARLRQMKLNATTGRLEIGSGVLNQDLCTLLPQQGRGRWVFPVGSCLGVGIAGLVLGGGINLQAGWAGLACDRLRSTRMIQASGDCIEASESENPDLFWAVQGAGGGNFGIHTRFSFDLLPPPVHRATNAELRVEGHAATVAAAMAWQQLRATAPEPVSGNFRMHPVQGGGIAATARVQVLGDERQARELLAPLLRQAVAHQLVERDWWEALLWYPTRPARESLWIQARYQYQTLPETALEEHADWLERCPGGPGSSASLEIMGDVGGAVDDRDRQATAYVHRGAQAIVRQKLIWPTPPRSQASLGGVPVDLLRWARSAWSALAPHLSDEAYQNFSEPDLQDWARAYYAENLPRLITLKRRYDPNNIFRYPQSLPMQA